MARTQFQNNGEDSLAAAVTNVATSITVNAGSKFPSSGDFPVIVYSDDTYEIMKVTSRSTNNLTVVRAQEGTIAVAHPAGAKVTHTVTADSIQDFFLRERELWGEQPDSMGLFDSGNVELKAADFTWVNQGSATATDNDHSISLYLPDPGTSNNQLRSIVRTAPATFDLRVAYIPQLYCDPISHNFFGVGVRDTTTGENWFIAEGIKEGAPSTNWGTRLLVTEYSSTTFSQNFVSSFGWASGRNIKWARVTFDGTDVTFYWSCGGPWHQIHQIDTTVDTFDVDQLIFCGMAGDLTTTNNDIYATLVAWRENPL